MQQRVHDFLRRAILEGELPPGSSLPSTRRLAAEWGVSRNTVLHAYEELAVEGLVCGRVGSGTRVRGRVQVPGLPDARTIVRGSQYPARAVGLRDPDGNMLYIQG